MLGMFLSGGIDSSVNAALFSEGEDAPVQTFTIGYEGSYRSYENETAYARLMADEVGAEYHERLLTADDLLDFLPEMVRLQDERGSVPNGDCLPARRVPRSLVGDLRAGREWLESLVAQTPDGRGLLVLEGEGVGIEDLRRWRELAWLLGVA